MKKIIISILLVCTGLLTGCSTTIRVKATDFHTIKPLDYNSTFKFASKNDQAVKAFTTNYSKQEVKVLWKEILPPSYKKQGSGVNAKYTFNIELLYKVRYQLKESMVSLMTYIHAGTLFRVTVFDANNKLIHEKLIKSYDLWGGKFGMSGPVTGFKTTIGLNNAIVKIGLSDVLKYISDGEFLKGPSGGVKSYIHDTPEVPFTLKTLKYPWLDPSNKKYIVGTPSIIYFKYIMGEKFKSVDELVAYALSNNLTDGNMNKVAIAELTRLTSKEYVNKLGKPGQLLNFTNSTKIINILSVLKLATDKNWPLRPANIDASNVPYRFN